MTLLDRLKKRPTREALEAEVKRLASKTAAHHDVDGTLQARNARLGEQLEEARHDTAKARDELVAARRELLDAQSAERTLRAQLVDLRRSVGTREGDPKRGDPAARRLVAMLLEQDKLPAGPFTDLCFMGPNGCTSHFGEKDCTVAWLKAWVAGHIASPGIAALAMVMTSVHDAKDVLREALAEYQTNHESAGAGDDLTGAGWRHKTRVAQNMAHAIAGNV